MALKRKRNPNGTFAKSTKRIKVADEKNSTGSKKNAAKTKSTTLMDLPGELRNSIYRYAMPIHETINVEKSYIQPGLMRVSKQIHHEAWTIYRAENKFKVTLQNLKLEPKATHWVWKTGEYRVIGEGSPSWSKFMAMMKAYWEIKHKKRGVASAIYPTAAKKDRSRTFKAKGCYEAFAAMCRMGKDGVQWKKIEKGLEKYKKGTEAFGLVSVNFADY